MRKSAVDGRQLLAVSARLGDAALDPAIWPEIMEQISLAVGATGAVLLQSDVRTADVPRTTGVGELVNNYFARRWDVRDMRGERGVPMLLRGDNVFIDQDVVTPDEVRQSAFYNECLAPFGFKWFAAIGFLSGSALWAMAIQRTAAEGPFEANDKLVLGELSQRLTEAATLSKAVSKAVLTGVANALHLVKQPALALDRVGFVLDMNDATEQVFDEEIRIRKRRLFVRDQKAMAALDEIIDQLRITPDTAALPVRPIVVRRRGKRPVIIRILPVGGAARSPFLGARALLVFSDLGHNSGPQPDLLAQTFGLSRAEARLASVMANGISPERAAEKLDIARETARNQLKAIFAKTDTHRQGELIALLSRL